MSGFGTGFAQGINAGTNMASKWIDVYNQAKQQQDVDTAMQPGGADMQEIGVDYIKQNFGLDDNAAAKMLDSLKADPTKARQLLNATNVVTGGAAGGQMGPPESAMVKPEAPPAQAIATPGPAYPDQISRRYPEAVAGKPTPQQSFLASNDPYLQALGKELGVHPSVLGGQFGLETGWGKSVIPGTFNLGNIKAGKNWTGPTVTAKDNAEGSNDPYRKYDNPEAFAKDFAGLIKTRYPGAVGAGEDAQKYFTALKNGGYATDPDYVAKGTAAVELARKNAPGGNLLAAPPQVQQAAIQTPQGQAAMADDISQMAQISERVRIPKSATFEVGPDGKLMMSTQKSPADQYMRVAQVYLKNGNVAGAKQAMDMHFQVKAQEAADFVKDIMTDDSMTPDQKIGALSKGTGIRIYKDKDGGYVSPDLSGSAGEGGKYKRLSMADIGQYASLMTTPEGMKYLYAHQLEQFKANSQARAVATGERKQALDERKEGTVNQPGSEAALRAAQTEYYNRMPKAGATGEPKDKGDVATVNADQTYAVNVPSGPGGKQETRQMQLWTPPAGVSGGTGMMDSSQIAKAPDILKALQKSPYGDPEGTGIRIGMQSNPVQYDPGTKNITGHSGQLSGQFTFPITMVNPATGQREPVGWADGKPAWSSENGGRVPMYRSVEQAEKAAKQIQEWDISQRKPGIDAARAAAKEDLDKAQAIRVPPRGIHPRKRETKE